MMRYLALFMICTLLAVSLRAAVEERWDVPLQTPPRHDVDVWRGETINLAPRFLDGSVPLTFTTNDAIMLYWQSAGMGNSWYSTNGLPHATPGRVNCPFTPACDVPGASNYTYFVGIAGTNGRSYRAYGTLRMRGSPGAVPNALALPTTTIDWATITSIHPGSAPFDPAGAAQAVSNGAASSLQTGLASLSNALATAIQAERDARQQGDTNGASALAVATNALSQALASLGSSASNYAALVAATAAGATNAAHVAAVDPHGDRAYAGGLLATGTAARATDAARLVQIDALSWVNVVGGTAMLWRVSMTQTTFMVAATIVNNNDTGILMTYRGGGYWWDGWTFQGGHSVYQNPGTTNWIFHTPNFGMTWVGGSYPTLPADVINAPDNHLTLQASGTDLVSVAVGAAYAVTNGYPLAQASDIPNLAPYATSAQLTAVSNLVAQAQATANTALTNVPSLDQVTTAGSTTANGVSINASHTRTNTYGGLVSILGRRVQSGFGSSATGLYSHAEGYGTSSGGMESHAEGYGTIANGVNSHAEGDTTVASGAASHAEGNGNTASGANSHAEGNNATASGSSSHAEGTATTASAGYSHAAGYWCKSTNSAAWVWSSGWGKPTYYISHGNNTFNVDPTGGVAGFYIGETNLDTYLALRTSFQDGTNIAAAVLSNVSTNNATVGGWLVWDTGSNVWRKVTCSNLSFFVESVP